MSEHWTGFPNLGHTTEFSAILINGKGNTDNDQSLIDMHSVTQSYANSFWGDVVLDSFNNVYRDEDNILDQIYVKQIRPDFYSDDFWFSNLIRKCILTLNNH